MAKRFVDTGIFRKRWIRQLDPNMKLFWVYLLTDCDHAGIWEVDIERAAFQLGVKLDEQTILKTFNRKIVPFKDGKWFLPKFIEYQYGELNEKVNAHKSVIKLLTKYGLNVQNQQLPNSCPTVKSTHLTVMDIDKDKDKDKDNKKKGKKEQLEEIKLNLPNYSKDFPHLNIKWYYDSFVDYLDSNDKRYKNYASAFKNCCRQEWYKDRPNSTKAGKSKSSTIVIACPSGHVQREASKGVRAVCPECHEQLKPIEEIQINRAIA